MKKRYFMEGLKSGLPICLGYFSVSIAFGMMAIHLKRPIGEAVLISLTNLTSAGQFAGLKIIGNRGGLIEVFLSTLIINARYFLMSLSISQKLAPKTKWYEKLLIAYGITDEIFAVSMSQTRALTFSYMMGVIVISVFGWVSGTFVGGIASSLLPVSVMDAFGIALYGMFIAIVIPAIKKNRNNRIAVMIALVLSTFFYFSSWLSEGWSIIVITVGISALMAWLCPIDQKEERLWMAWKEMLVMMITTYVIRLSPFVLFRKKIKNRFIQSFLYYVPYVVLSAMTFPAILFSTSSKISALLGTGVAIVLAYEEKSLIVVALGAAIGAWLGGLF